MTEIVHEIEEKVKHVPKKVWVIGGIALVLLLLFLRKKAIRESSSGTNDGLSAAMMLPTGLQYAPISSGVGGGTGSGNTDITGQLNNIPGVGTLTGTGSTTTPPSTVISTSPITGTNSTAPSGGSFVSRTGPYGTGVFDRNDTEVSWNDIVGFFGTHPFDTATHEQESHAAAANLGFSDEAWFRARDLYTSQNLAKTATPAAPVNTLVPPDRAVAVVPTPGYVAPAATPAATAAPKTQANDPHPEGWTYFPNADQWLFTGKSSDGGSDGPGFGGDMGW